MNRLPVAERREQLIEAALAVASRDGIDAATVRAVAAEAGVSLGVVHYCFQDKGELMRAMAHAITGHNAVGSLDGLPAGSDVVAVVDRVLGDLWVSISAHRGAQLLSYELTTSSLRHAELAKVAEEQYAGSWTAAEQALELIERTAGVTWALPRAEMARAVVALVDGYTLAWLVDGDDRAARAGLRSFAGYLAGLARPAPSAVPSPVDDEATSTPGQDTVPVPDA